MQPNPFLKKVLLKTLLIFLFINIVFTVVAWPSVIGQFSAYNLLFPGRDRFPFGEDQVHAYNLSLYNLDAMFSSLNLAGDKKPVDEYRILFFGDSSVWGTLLTPEQTLTGQINKMHLHTCDGRRIKAYNLGYPTLSVTKDLMMMDEGKKYRPDMIVWLMTLESLPDENQLKSPIVANNPDRLSQLSQKYGLANQNVDLITSANSLYQKSIIGQRRALADLFRLQLYGVMWAATGIDQVYPDHFPPAQRDLENDNRFHSMLPPQINEGNLALDVIKIGMSQGKDIQIILVNEPILISAGKNSDIRYNFFYPRWAYDQYRQLLANMSLQYGWNYLDLWDQVPENQFTNSAIHLSPVGEATLAERISSKIVEICTSNKPISN